MNHKSFIFVLFFALAFSLISTVDVYSGHRDISETDSGAMQLYSVFDLRDRESYMQVTNTNSSDITVHVQIFNVDQDCNENNFYDTLTPNDTHVYNMADIQTNNGNPSGVVLPDDAYGGVVITYVLGVGMNSVADTPANRDLIGNFRIIDDKGYEYRTNMAGFTGVGSCGEPPGSVAPRWTFNFNVNSGITLSDIFLLTYNGDGGGEIEVTADTIDEWILFDVDIFDLNENVFSCRNVIFACMDEDNPRLEELLEEVESKGSGSASIASFEYGINEVLPSSKNAPLLCPGNTINEGIVRLDSLNNEGEITYLFVGLNNDNGRGSMDAFWSENCATPGTD